MKVLQHGILPYLKGELVRRRGGLLLFYRNALDV